MKIFDLECCGCRRKYTFTIEIMQWPKLPYTLKTKDFEEAIFGFDCPACNYRNAFQFRYLLDARLERAAKWAAFSTSVLECRMTTLCRMASYERFDALKLRWEKRKAFLDAVQNARLELFEC